jgi:WD40 repeat protein
MQVRSLPDGKILSTIPNESQALVSDLVFNSNSHVILADNYYGIVREWDVQTQKLIRSFQFSDPVIYLQIGLNGKQVLADYGLTGFELWDANSGKLLHTYDDIVSASGFQRLSVNSNYVAVWGYTLNNKDSGLSVWDLLADTKLSEFVTPLVNGDGWRCGVLNSDSSVLAASNNEGYIYFYNLKSGQKIGEIFLPYKFE